MKEHPILFSGEMVQAILDGRKTQTRRVIKPQPGGRVVSFDSTDGQWYSRSDGRHIDWLHRCPYGAPGDRLWVREKAKLLNIGGNWFELLYSADEEIRRFKHEWVNRGPYSCTRWTPSIHMPRWASRLTLEVTAVRVERVQEINLVQHDEVLKEGWPWGREWPNRNPVHDFAELWDSLNAKRGYGWDVNPWCWVIEFTRRKP